MHVTGDAASGRSAPPVGYRSGESLEQSPVWQRANTPENRWTAFFAVIAKMFLQRAIPLKYEVVPRWPLIALEGVLLVVLVITFRRVAAGRDHR